MTAKLQSNRRVAQLAAHRTHIPEVDGANPSPAPNLHSIRCERLARRIEALAFKVWAEERDIPVVCKAIVLNADSLKALVLWSKDSTGFADLPGGHIHAGETPSDGLRREVREETGLELARLTELEARVRPDGKTVLFFVGFAATEDVKLSWEHTKFEWVDFLSASNMREQLGWLWTSVQKVLWDNSEKRMSVTAATPEYAHSAAQDAAEVRVREAAEQILNAAQMQALVLAEQGGTKKELETRRQEFNEAAGVVMDASVEDAYEVAHKTLSTGDDELLTGRQEEKRQLSIADAAEDHAEKRSELLTAFPDETLRRLEDVALGAGKNKKARARAVKKEAEAIRARVANVARSEGQAAYGKAALKRLRKDKFTHKRWVTMEDDKVRPSHVECAAQGAIPQNQVFSNGCRYPGDPKGGAAEVCNCRCQLRGENQ